LLAPKKGVPASKPAGQSANAQQSQ
jgi:hypothetical protein